MVGKVERRRPNVMLRRGLGRYSEAPGIQPRAGEAKTRTRIKDKTQITSEFKDRDRVKRRGSRFEETELYVRSRVQDVR